MKKQDIQDLMMGAAVVVVGFMLYRQFKPGAAGTSALQPIVGGQITPTYDPMFGAPYNADTVAGRIGLADLWTGINKNTLSGTGYDYLGSITNPQLTGNGGHDSIFVKGWWN